MIPDGAEGIDAVEPPAVHEAGLHPRYVREWLEGMTVGRIVGRKG